MPNKNEVSKIANEAWRQLQVLNNQAGRPFNLKEAFHTKGDALQVTVKKTASYIYKFFIKYDHASDTYSTRFGKMYTGKDSSREDWMEFMVTEWDHDIYSGMLLTSLQHDFDNKNTPNLFHRIRDEWTAKEVIGSRKADEGNEPVATCETSPAMKKADYESVDTAMKNAFPEEFGGVKFVSVPVEEFIKEVSPVSDFRQAEIESNKLFAQAVESLTPVIGSEHMSDESKEIHAIVHLISSSIEWDGVAAVDIIVELLEDISFPSGATEATKKILKGKLAE